MEQDILKSLKTIQDQSMALIENIKKDCLKQIIACLEKYGSLLIDNSCGESDYNATYYNVDGIHDSPYVSVVLMKGKIRVLLEDRYIIRQHELDIYQLHEILTMMILAIKGDWNGIYRFEKKNVVYRFKRKDHMYWDDMAEKCEWDFVAQFLPNYYHRYDVTLSDDMECVADGEKSLEDFTMHHQEYAGCSIYDLYSELNRLDYQLKIEAADNLKYMIESSEIEVKQFSVSTVSARILSNTPDEDQLELTYSNLNYSNFGTTTKVAATRLQNVKSRWLDEGTDNEQFQVLYENHSAGESHWCNAQSIDFG